VCVCVCARARARARTSARGRERDIETDRGGGRGRGVSGRDWGRDMHCQVQAEGKTAGGGGGRILYSVILQMYPCPSTSCVRFLTSACLAVRAKHVPALDAQYIWGY
jgi:hypothetical protein